VLPGVVAIELVVAQSEQAAVCVSRLAGYPTGFEFELRTMVAPGADPALDPMLFGPHRMRARQAAGHDRADQELRFGVQFSDGGKATNTGIAGRLDEPPVGPVMHSGGGGGGGGDWRQTEWVWPLPPPGSLWFVCQWPAAGIPLSRAEIDAGTILDASARARTIFPGAESSWGGASVSSVTFGAQRVQPQAPSRSEGEAPRST
jgi:hypothetical protein